MEVFDGPGTSINSIVYSPLGDLAITGGDDFLVRAWDVTSGKTITRFQGHGTLVRSVAIARDGRFIVSSANEPFIRLWDLASGKEVSCHRMERSGYAACVTFTPSGQSAVIGGSTGDVLFLEAPGLRLQRQFHLPWVAKMEPLSSISISSDGLLLAAAAYGQSDILIARVDDGAILHRLKGHTDAVRCVRFEAAGGRLVSGSEDKTVRVWDLAKEGKSFAFSGHTDRVIAVAVATTASLVASAGADKIIRVWNLDTGREAGMDFGHTEKIWSLAFSPMKLELLSASEDGKIRCSNLSGCVGDVHIYVDVSQVVIERDVLAKVPEEIARQHVVLPLERTPNGLQIATSRMDDEDFLARLEFIFDCKIVPVRSEEAQLRDAINHHYGVPLRCPSCDKAGRAPGRAIGRRATCKACGATFSVASPEFGKEDLGEYKDLLS